MSDNETNQEDEKPFYADRAKTARSTCKKCKEKIAKGEMRIAKVVANMFGAGKMKQWFHPNCLFESFLKQRVTTKRLEDPEDVGNWENLTPDEQNDIINCINDSEKNFAEKHGTTPPSMKKVPVKKEVSSSTNSSVSSDESNKDILFREFRRLCADISNISSYTEKTALVKDLFKNGRDGNGFKGDVEQWCRLLLPGAVKRIYNLQSRQLVKLFSRVFHTDFDDMVVDLEEGDVAETISKFFAQSNKLKPASKSLLTMNEVDEFLENLSKMTKEDEQTYHLKQMSKKCTTNDLKMVVRLIKHDLRINAGPKHILEGLHPDAYTIFQSSRDIKLVISKVLKNKEAPKKSQIKATIELMTPVLPMLAEPCRSVEIAMKKCPNGMYSEIKYDGERVQVHKQGSEFKYFSRSLKPVVLHKVNHFKDYIPQAFPYGEDLILDSEILMIDTITGKPLPFGTLGIHKQSEIKNANVCLFVFDCIYYNGEILTKRPIKERRSILLKNMKQVENHIMFSEMKEIHNPSILADMIVKTLKEGLEGLVLKDLSSIYEPGKRHWLKIKKDYLFDGQIADTADLVVLGAWYGTGKKGGMMSVFLMGCFDPKRKKWCTVTKVHTGHDDQTLERLQTELDMFKISCDVSKVPDWLVVTKTMIPDFVAKDPKNQPVWEITGAEFTRHEVHTADGISVRFPRVTKIRDDKTWEHATNLDELNDLVKKSKETMDGELFNKLNDYLKDYPQEENDSSKKGSLKQKKIDDVLNKPSTSKNGRLSSPIKTKMDESWDSSPSKKIKSNHKKHLKRNFDLPDVFCEVKIYFLDKLDEIIVRYFVAYGGEVVMKIEDKMTHVVHSDKYFDASGKKFPRDTIHVTVDWLKDSIKTKKVLDTKHYAVILN